jgi:hypothetical protein
MRAVRSGCSPGCLWQWGRVALGFADGSGAQSGCGAAMRSPPRRVEIGERKLLKTRDPLPCIFRLGFGYPIYDRRKMKPEDSPTFKVNHQAAVRSAQIPPQTPDS